MPSWKRRISVAKRRKAKRRHMRRSGDGASMARLFRDPHLAHILQSLSFHRFFSFNHRKQILSPLFSLCSPQYPFHSFPPKILFRFHSFFHSFIPSLSNHFFFLNHLHLLRSSFACLQKPFLPLFTPPSWAPWPDFAPPPTQSSPPQKRWAHHWWHQIFSTIRE